MGQESTPPPVSEPEGQDDVAEEDTVDLDPGEIADGLESRTVPDIPDGDDPED